MKQGLPELKLSTAVRMSASFPFFSPAITLPTWPRRRVVDAGYYDNYGVSVASSFLFSSSHRDWIEKNASGVLFIQIRDGLSDGERVMGAPPADATSPPPNQMQLALEEFSSPLEGVLSARVSSASYRNDGMLELLAQFYKELDQSKEQSKSGARPEKSFYFTTVAFEYPFNASLSWYLTRRERAAIRDASNCPPLKNFPVPPAPKTAEAKKRVADQENAEAKIRQDLDSLTQWWQDRAKAGKSN